jgi:hypothetical protein
MGVKKMVSIKTIRRDRLLQRWQNYPNIALLLGVIVELEKGLGVSKNYRILYITRTIFFASALLPETHKQPLRAK